jgi:molybdopterin molybdotransferase
MVDHATVEVAKSVAPGTNLLGASDDAARGEVLIAAGRRLRPQDVGLMAALGVERVRVRTAPRVGIISTGDEVVPISAAPGPGQVRDVNTYTLAALAAEAGAQPVILGLVGDDRQKLRSAVERSLAGCHLTLLSGGSSVGQRDHTADVFMAQPGAELLVHGVAVSPGKPFIWVSAEQGHLLGLPGQVASCVVSFYLLVEPIIERLLGRPARPFTRFGRLKGRLAQNLPSAPGREEYHRVRVVPEDGSPQVQPVFGKSGLIRTLTQGHGLVRVPRDSEGLEAGQDVTVLLFPLENIDEADRLPGDATA